MTTPNPLPFYEIESTISQNIVSIENKEQNSNLWIYVGFFSLIVITCIVAVEIDKKDNESK